MSNENGLSVFDDEPVVNNDADQKVKDIKVAVVKKSEVADESKVKNTVTWQFRYKGYVHLMNIFDKNGRQLNLKARNYRVDLNLDIPEEKEQHEELLKSNQKDVDFWMLKDVNRAKDRIKDRAQTLQKLQKMTIEQLLTFMSNDELEQMGLLPGVPDKNELIMAIIDTKKLA